MRKLNTAINKKINEILPDVPVYPAIADADAAMPYVVYTDESFTVDRTKDGPLERLHSVSVELYVDDFDKGDEMADKLADNMNCILAPGVYSLLMGGSSDYTGEGYVFKLDFDVEVDA